MDTVGKHEYVVCEVLTCTVGILFCDLTDMLINSFLMLMQKLSRWYNVCCCNKGLQKNKEMFTCVSFNYVFTNTEIITLKKLKL